MRVDGRQTAAWGEKTAIDKNITSQYEEYVASWDDFGWEEKKQMLTKGGETNIGKDITS